MLAALFVVVCALGAAGAIIVFAWGWTLLRTDPPVPQYLVRQRVRRRRRLPQDDRGPTSAMLEAIGRPFRHTLANLLGRERMASAQRRIGAAGKANVVTPEQYLARRAGAIVLMSVIGILFLLLRLWAPGVLFILLGQVWVDGHLWVLARNRAGQIERQLPDFLDVLAVTVSAGLGFRRALARVAQAMPGPLAEEFTIALHQMELGTSRREAFRQLRDRARSAPLTQLITAILQAEELGAPLSDALVEIATDMRQNAAQLARRQAARTVPRVTLVTAFLLVPAVLILFVGSIVFALFIGGDSGFLG